MNNTPRIEGTPDPRQLGKLGQKDEINTEQFKKILRVDKSDEAEQRNKRNLKKSEEGDDEEAQKSEEANTPQTLFSELMKEHQKTTSLFDVKGGKEQTLTAEATTQAAIDTSSATSKAALPPYNLINEGSTATQEASKKKKKEVEKKEEAPQQFSLSKEETSAPPKESSAPPQKTKELAIPTSEKPSLVSKEAEETASIPIEIPKILQSEPITTSPDTEISSLQKGKGPILEDSNEGKEDSQSREKKEKAGATENIQTNPDTPPIMTPEGITPTETPTYSSLSPHLFELFEQMIGLITIELSNKGVSTTTIKLSMPGSVFHGCEIKLDHYDTAPHSFNVQLLGTPEAVQSFSSNLSRLVSSFQQEKYSFSVHIQSPALLKEEQPLFKRKESVGNEMGNSSQESHK